MSVLSSGYSSNSSGRKSNRSYTTCDYGLVLMQRLLISVSVILGYDLVYSPRDFPEMRLIQAMTRILRNFFYLTKAIRKWLAINYNDGIIPEPPVRGSRSLRILRSTPRESCAGSQIGGSLKQSPIDRHYSEPAKNYDFATALKEHNRSVDGEPRNNYYHEANSSDFLGHTSLSFRFLLNSLAQSVVGYIEDPDEEMNKLEVQETNGDEAKKQPRQHQEVSEKARRTAMVVESVLEHDAEQKKLQSSSNDSEEGEKKREPLPILNFDDSTMPEHAACTTRKQMKNFPKNLLLDRSL